MKDVAASLRDDMARIREEHGPCDGWKVQHDAPIRDLTFGTACARCEQATVIDIDGTSWDDAAVYWSDGTTS